LDDIASCYAVLGSCLHVCASDQCSNYQEDAACRLPSALFASTLHTPQLLAPSLPFEDKNVLLHFRIYLGWKRWQVRAARSKKGQQDVVTVL
jgi:hypothetical protein